MKKVTVILFIFLSVFFSVSVFAVDFGSILYNSTGMKYARSDNNVDFRQNDMAGLWVSANVMEMIDIYLRGSYTFSYSSLNPPDKPHFFDLDTLTIKNTGNVPLIVTAGRFSDSDFSHYIFSNRIDGISAELNIPLLSAKATLGYNGLLFKERSTVIMTRADISDLDNNSKLFASPRVIGGIDILFPELFLRQDLDVSFWTQFDLRQFIDPAAGRSSLYSQYYGLGLKGAIIDSLYYKTAFYFESGLTYSAVNDNYSYILSYMGTAGISYYMDWLLFSRAGITFFYSSGDPDYTSTYYEGNAGGYSLMFIPISSTPFGKVFSPELGNIFLVKVDYSLKPFSFISSRAFGGIKDLQVDIEAFSFFRSTTGTISVTGLNSQSSSLYLGTEIDGNISIPMFSDLKAIISGGLFIPDNRSGGAFGGGSVDIEGKASIDIFFQL